MIKIDTDLTGKLIEFHSFEDYDPWFREKEEEELTLGGVYSVIEWDDYGDALEDVITVRGRTGESIVLQGSQFHVVGDVDANKDN